MTPASDTVRLRTTTAIVLAVGFAAKRSKLDREFSAKNFNKYVGVMSSENRSQPTNGKNTDNASVDNTQK